MPEGGFAMGKTIVVLLLIAAAGYFVYQRFNQPASEEEQLVAHLGERFAVNLEKFTSAAGRAGMTGLDSSYDIEIVITEIRKVRTELAGLRPRLAEAKAIRKADELSVKIERFFKKNELLAP
jgi:hypothetical protein